ncbi:MAG: ribonuclease HII [Fibrobacter sp.]|nr:ribonuclease HII [Fibrobacter sp.]
MRRALWALGWAQNTKQTSASTNILKKNGQISASAGISQQNAGVGDGTGILQQNAEAGAGAGVLQRSADADAGAGISRSSDQPNDSTKILQRSVEIPAKDLFALVDGNQYIKGIEYTLQSPLVKGDDLVLSVAAASVLAKVSRDKIMEELGEAYPDYGFARHKGYPTKAHKLAIHENGYTPFHRRSFKL